MGDTTVDLGPVSNSITTIAAPDAFLCSSFIIITSTAAANNILNNKIACQFGCYFAVVDHDAIGFSIAAFRELRLPISHFINTVITVIIYCLYFNRSPCKINCTAVDLQTYCRGATMFSSVYIYLVAIVIILIVCFSFHIDISRRDRQIVFDLEPISRCRTGITRKALVSTAVPPTGGSYCDIACGNTAQVFIYCYFSNGIAASSTLHHCR